VKVGPKVQEVDPTGAAGAEVRLTNWSLHILFFSLFIILIILTLLLPLL